MKIRKWLTSPWVRKNLPTLIRIVVGKVIEHEKGGKGGTMTKIRSAGFLLLVGAVLSSCGGVNLPPPPPGPPCIFHIDGTPAGPACGCYVLGGALGWKSWTLRKCPEPAPAPSPSATAAPPPASPAPIPVPTPVPSPDATPAPPASPAPCVTPPPAPPVEEHPLCLNAEGQVAVDCQPCVTYMAGQLAGGDLTACSSSAPGRPCAGAKNRAFNDAMGAPGGRDCFDTKTCDLVDCADGSVRAHRLQKDGSVCSPPGCVKVNFTVSDVVAAAPPCVPQSPPTIPPSTGIPSSCPPLVKWGGGVHAQRTPAFEGIDKFPVFVGNFITNDSTERFGSGERGQPCNDEHHDLCTLNPENHVHTPGPDGVCTSYRKCEDPRGPVWRVVQGDSKCKTEAAGWQLGCGPMQPGHHVIEICPRGDLQDAYGVPVKATGNACTQFPVDPK